MRDKIIQERDYDSSIHGNELSLKISSYPVTAKYLAERLAEKGNTICELCCGIGVSLMEFSHHFINVTGIDSDSQVIENAQNNLSNANVENCKLIVGDITDRDILSKINADVVTYDIPYWSDHEGTVKDKNPELKSLIEKVQTSITSNIVIYAPTHMSQEYFTQLFDSFEYQEVWIDGKHDRNFIYLGSLINSPGLTKISLSNR